MICIHGGGNSEYLEPVVLYCGEESPVAYKSREMAQCFGFKGLVEEHPLRGEQRN